MTSGTTHLIIGASLASAKAAQTLRGEGFDGPLVMIGAEHERPYERPPLSKDYLLGKAERETVYVHPRHWYAEHHVNLRLGVAATAIHPSAHEVTLADGSSIGYGKLLLTTGSSPRRLPVPGTSLDGVLYLRNVGDSDAIKAAFESSSRVAVIGAGWIGLEAAAAGPGRGPGCDRAGNGETAAAAGARPRSRPGLRHPAQDHGVDLRCGVQVAEITGSGGRADGVLLADGSRIEADVVIAGVGITPNSELALAAGLEVSNGIRVDAQLRSSDPDIARPGIREPSALARRARRGRALGRRAAPGQRPPGRCSARTWPKTGCPPSYRPVRPGHGVLRLRRTGWLRRGRLPR